VCSFDASSTSLVTQHLPAVSANIVNTNGAGDCLVAGSLAHLVQGNSPVDALAFGMVSASQDAVMTLFLDLLMKAESGICL